MHVCVYVYAYMYVCVAVCVAVCACVRVCNAQVDATAVSTTDYVALSVLMMDIRVKLLEDHIDVHTVRCAT